MMEEHKIADMEMRLLKLENKIDKLSPIWDETIGNRTLEPESDFGFGKVTVS